MRELLGALVLLFVGGCGGQHAVRSDDCNPLTYPEAIPYKPAPQVKTYSAPSYSYYSPSDSYLYSKPFVAENGSYYGEPNQYGVPKTVYVRSYFRADGTYVRGYYRGKAR